MVGAGYHHPSTQWPNPPMGARQRGNPAAVASQRCFGTSVFVETFFAFVLFGFSLGALRFCCCCWLPCLLLAFAGQPMLVALWAAFAGQPMRAGLAIATYAGCGSACWLCASWPGLCRDVFSRLLLVCLAFLRFLVIPAALSVRRQLWYVHCALFLFSPTWPVALCAPSLGLRAFVFGRF